MKGKIAQRRYYDRVLPTLKAVMRRVRRLPAGDTTSSMPYRLRGCRLCHRRLRLHDRNGRSRRRLHSRKPGNQGRALHITCFRPFPSIEMVEALRHCQGHFRDRAPRHSDDAVQSAALRDQGRIRRRASPGTPGYPRIHRMPRVLRRLRRLGQPRRPRRRFHRHRRKHAQRPARGTYFTVGIKHETALPVTDRSGRARRRVVLDARPFGGRLRLGHHQQGHRHHRRRSVRHGRAGLSEIRFGKEGPADHLLPDHRQRAHPRSLGTRARGIRCRSTTSTPSTWKIRWPGLPRTEWCSSKARKTDPTKSGLHPGVGARRR